MIRAVVENYAEVDCWKSREHSLVPCLLNAFLDRGNVISGNGASKNFVHEFEVAAARQRFHANLAIAILTVTAALLFVFALNVCFSLDRFTIRNFGRMK